MIDEKAEAIESSVKQEDIADIMNAINDIFEEKGLPYDAVGYDNTGCWLMVIIDKKSPW